MIKDYDISLDQLSTNLWLSVADLQVLHNKNHLIGLHSHDHPTVLANLSQSQQEYQYQKNLNFLKKICGDIISMSHPCNSYNSITLIILKRLGIKIGFRSTLSNYNMLNLDNHFLQCPREDSANIYFMSNSTKL